MTKRKSKNRLFMLMSIAIVVLIFTLGISNSGFYIRHVGSTESPRITHDTSGTTWVCTWDNGYYWRYTYSDGTEVGIKKYISEGHTYVNCEPGYLLCSTDRTCDSSNEGATCICEKQLDTFYSEKYATSKQLLR